MRALGPLPSISLRPATPDDVWFLTEVYLVANRAAGHFPADFDEPTYRSRFSAWTDAEIRAGAGTSVIEIDGTPAGRIRIVHTDEALELSGIQLLPAYQGHGFGSYLVELLISDARRSGRIARLGVEKGNVRAQALYERLGFVRTSETEDGYLMERAVRPAAV